MVLIHTEGTYVLNKFLLSTSNVNKFPSYIKKVDLRLVVSYLLNL